MCDKFVDEEAQRLQQELRESQSKEAHEKQNLAFLNHFGPWS